MKHICFFIIIFASAKHEIEAYEYLTTPQLLLLHKMQFRLKSIEGFLNHLNSTSIAQSSPDTESIGDKTLQGQEQLTNRKLMELMHSRIEHVEKQLKNSSTSEVEFNIPTKVDCKEKCIQDSSCTSVSWRNSLTSECQIIRDKNTKIKFTPGEHYYCKDCESTIPLIIEGEKSGVIKIVNVALNKTTDASSHGNSTNQPSMAVDGNFNTRFLLNTPLIKNDPWIMIDLGNRFMVTTVGIHVKDTKEQKNRGGYFKVCLVNQFDRKVNPCNSDTEVLQVNDHLSLPSLRFDVERVIMGRYLVLKKINKHKILELLEVEVEAAVPALPFETSNSKNLDFLSNKDLLQDMHFRLNNIELYVNNFNYTLVNLPESKFEVDCRETCIQEEFCTSVFWSIYIDSGCHYIWNKTIQLEFSPGIIFYCKDCETTTDQVVEGLSYDAIKLVNVALNKIPVSSSHSSLNIPSNAVDGNLSTEFSSKATKDNAWLRIDLENRYLVGAIKIQVKNNVKNLRKGGNIKVCLVDVITANPCPEKTKILKISTLTSSSEVFDVSKIIMGRFIVLQKLRKHQVLEIAEIDIEAVVPFNSYNCTTCNTKPNTVCDASSIISNCKCAEETKLFPIHGDATNGCQNPCSSFEDKNTICIPVNYENYTCQCKQGYFPTLENDHCSGCQNPCHDFRGENAICIPIDKENFKCQCKRAFYSSNNDPCNDCKLDCPWELNYSHFENFGCLKVHSKFEDRADWSVARDICVSEGGDLFTPVEELPILPQQLDLPYNLGFWIGVKKNKEGQYKIVALPNEPVLSYQSPLWDSVNIFRNEIGQCLIYDSGSKLVWSYYCIDLNRFICQIIPE